MENAEKAIMEKCAAGEQLTETEQAMVLRIILTTPPTEETNSAVIDDDREIRLVKKMRKKPKTPSDIRLISPLHR